MTVSLPNESTEYRLARNALLAAEIDLRTKIEEVAALRRALPTGGQLPEDYVFRDLRNEAAPMSSLFGAQNTLIIYSLMYRTDATAPCPMCSAFLDALNSQVDHLSQKVSLAVVAQNTPEMLLTLKDRMGWNSLPLYSALGTAYQNDYLAESEDGSQLPILNVFQKDAAGIHHFWSSEMFFAPSDWHPRHIDAAWPLWNLLDFTPGGRGDFMPPLR
ncbi:Predicted dithiol-disulfide oxidoreductase, DUF899 family [Ruegeria halocynthiae]|uniref:Predicted dithiol-disulfide oxidoreductase, DUF899 family n=1 Tax=Ruegeria halocynthiae TaxID=985054 RepID=A0A1H3BIE8_9RHOB|nr:DUF899 family protein [Ruegeria halocynthiae]SDX41697.1 Predicted dithiol-disulfide oxidoreductase, DUF899 family [Ruegeria halocynthiae]